MRALLGPASLVCLLSACTVVEEGAEEADLEAGLGGRFDDARGADDGEHERLVVQSVFQPPSDSLTQARARASVVSMQRSH